MGLGLSWLAAEGVDRASLLADMGLMESGVASDELNSPLACAEFPGGWLVFVSSDMGLDLDQALPLASRGGLALGCELEEHVMFSRLRAFRAGAPAWAVTHDPDVDLDGVAFEGEPPPAFADLRAALAAEQASRPRDGVDYMFDLPVRLGQQLCGYAHDEPRPVVWTILERAGRRREPGAARSLSEAFTSDILPLLTASGWSPCAEDPDFSGRAWDLTRVVGGRRELLRFLGLQNGPILQFEPSFVVFDGTGWMDKVLVSGEMHPARQAGGGSGRSFWRRLGDLLGGKAPDAPRVDPLAQLVSRVHDDLAAIDAYLTTGAESPRLSIKHRPGYY